VKAIVLTCAGRTFIAGADITEFGKPPKPPGLHEVLSEIENSPKPVVGRDPTARRWAAASKSRSPAISALRPRTPG